MNGLLDTHAFIWMDSNPARLSAQAAAFIRDPANTVYLSVISVWEMLIKQRLGKLQLHEPLPRLLKRQRANGVRIMNVRLRHALSLARLPSVHRDPFDRFLISQAVAEKAAIITVDPQIAKYPVKVVW